MTERTVNGSAPPPKEIDDSIMWIGQVSEVLYSNNVPKTDKPYSQLQQELHTSAISLSTATNEVISSVNSPKHLATASKEMGNAFGNLVEVGMEIVGSTNVSGRINFLHLTYAEAISLVKLKFTTLPACITS